MSRKKNKPSQPEVKSAEPKSVGAAAAVPLEEKIRTLAYHKWEVAGCPGGDGINFWIDAEREILGE